MASKLHCDTNRSKITENLPPKSPAVPCCSDPAFVPSQVSTELCSGEVSRDVTATMEMVLASGTVIYTRRCPDEHEFDSGVLCDPTSDTRVVWVVNYDATGTPTTRFFTLTGDVFTGSASDLMECEVDTESDGVNWCFDGQEVIQWIVKTAGRPNGTIYWTGQDGLVISAPSGPNLLKGSCAVNLDTETVAACFTTNDGETLVGITPTLQYDESGSLVNIYYQDENGLEINPNTFLGGGRVSLGPCQNPNPQVDCVESQEWTYGIDNTGTRYTEDNTIKIGLSDGTSFTFNQPPTTGWTPQMALWGAEIQQAADNAGLSWFVDTRYRDPTNPSNLAGGGGFPGPASTVISNALVGMEWRYVNIQICPSQPVPVSAVIIASSNPARVGYHLTTAGAVKGPLQRFFVCRQCGEEPKWYLSDGETVAEQGQIPNCYEPCGVLSQLPPPPENNCQFEITEGCDNNNSTDSVDFTVGITRRASVCNGNEIGTDFFRADPLDPNALIPYTMVGVFVDCASGEPIMEPVPDCAETTYVGKLYQIDSSVELGTKIDWWAPATYPNGSNAAPHGNVSSIFQNIGSTLSHVNGAPDVSFTSLEFSVNTASSSFIASVGAAGSMETYGTDQLKLSGYIVLGSAAILQDTNPNTGERGAIYVNICCSGDLELLFERTSDTLSGQVGVFEGVRLPAGIHYIEAVTSDLSAWQGLELSVSFDDGATYEPFTSYTTKPAYTCIPVIRCEVTGILLNAETSEPIVSGPFDSWCEPEGCNVSASETFDGNIIDLTPNPDQTHVIVSGVNTNVPAGFKSVTINNLTGTTTVNGVFSLGGGRRVTNMSYNATEVDRARGLLPEINLAGGTWQWTAISPIAEV